MRWDPTPTANKRFTSYRPFLLVNRFSPSLRLCNHGTLFGCWRIDHIGVALSRVVPWVPLYEDRRRDFGGSCSFRLRCLGPHCSRVHWHRRRPVGGGVSPTVFVQQSRAVLGQRCDDDHHLGLCETNVSPKNEKPDGFCFDPVQLCK